MGNPNRKKQCNNCGKIGYGPETCRSRTKVPAKGRQIQQDQRHGVTFINGNTGSSSPKVPSDTGDEETNTASMHVILEEDISNDHLMAVKCKADGQPMSKSQRTDSEWRMQIEQLSNPAPQVQKSGARPGRVPETKDNKRRKLLLNVASSRSSTQRDAM